jgi:hypothetical protein
MLLEVPKFPGISKLIVIQNDHKLDLNKNAFSRPDVDTIPRAVNIASLFKVLNSYHRKNSKPNGASNAHKVD